MSQKLIKLNRSNFSKVDSKPSNYIQKPTKNTGSELLQRKRNIKRPHSPKPNLLQNKKNIPLLATVPSKKKTAIVSPIPRDCNILDKPKLSAIALLPKPVRRDCNVLDKSKLSSKMAAVSKLVVKKNNAMPVKNVSLEPSASTKEDAMKQPLLKLDRSRFKAKEGVKQLTSPSQSRTATKSPTSSPVIRKLVRKSFEDILAESDPKASSTPNESKRSNQKQQVQHVAEESKSNVVKISGSVKFSLPPVKQSLVKLKRELNSPSHSLGSTSHISLVNKAIVPGEKAIPAKNKSDDKSSESNDVKRLKTTNSILKTSPQTTTSNWKQLTSPLDQKKALQPSESKLRFCSQTNNSKKPSRYVPAIRTTKDGALNVPPQKRNASLYTQSRIQNQSVSHLNSNRNINSSTRSQGVSQNNINEQTLSRSSPNLWRKSPARTIPSQLLNLKRSASGLSKFDKTSSSSSRESSTPRTLSSASSNVSSSSSVNVSSNALVNVSGSRNGSKDTDGLNDSLETDVEMIDISTCLRSLDVLNCPMEIDDNLPSDQNSYVFVVDTNILIHDLNFIDELKDTPLEGCGPPYIYIPWIVLCELDGLKSENNENKFRVIAAVRYIFSMLDSKHPRVRGQTVKMSRELEQTFGNKNDDLLLSYCTLLAKKIPKEKVCLLTNDKNLCNKGFVNDVRVYTRETLFQNIKPDVRVFREKNCALDFINKQENSTPSKTVDTPMNEKMEVDAIICEAKLIMKGVLEPFLEESIHDAFGYLSKKFLTPPPTCLREILDYYKKYWTAVFSMIFNKNLKDKFERLIKLFNYSRGFFCNADDAFAALIAIENICEAIAIRKPSIRPKVKRISELTDKCKTLFKAEDDKVEFIEKSNNETVLAVFTHLWLLINHLCGMIMDFAGIQHKLVYDKPLTTPSLAEFQMLISNLFPAMHKIKQAMSKVIDITSPAEQEKHSLEYKHLYDYLLQFVPSLQIQAEPPPTDSFTVQSLKAFCLDPECREKLKYGYQQLVDYQKMLIECIHLPIWQS